MLPLRRLHSTIGPGRCWCCLHRGQVPLLAVNLEPETLFKKVGTGAPPPLLHPHSRQPSLIQQTPNSSRPPLPHIFPRPQPRRVLAPARGSSAASAIITGNATPLLFPPHARQPSQASCQHLRALAPRPSLYTSPSSALVRIIISTLITLLLQADTASLGRSAPPPPSDTHHLPAHPALQKAAANSFESKALNPFSVHGGSSSLMPAPSPAESQSKPEISFKHSISVTESGPLLNLPPQRTAISTASPQDTFLVMICCVPWPAEEEEALCSTSRRTVALRGG